SAGSPPACRAPVPLSPPASPPRGGGAGRESNPRRHSGPYLASVGEPGRDTPRRSAPVRHRTQARPAHGLRARHPLLPWRTPGPAGRPGRVRLIAVAVPEYAARGAGRPDDVAAGHPHARPLGAPGDTLTEPGSCTAAHRRG